MKPTFWVLGIISLAHCLNDATQSLLFAIYPLLRANFELSFVQLGFLTFAFQMCASVLQPVVGFYTDKHPKPYSLPVGMAFSLTGLLVIAMALGYVWLMVGLVIVGIGSAIFHPESSRVALAASAGRFGLAQSIFQVGGNVGQALGPLLAAVFVMRYGQISLAFFALLPCLASISLAFISRWAVRQSRIMGKTRATPVFGDLPRTVIIRTVFFLFILMFSKQVYTKCISNFLTFYLMEKFGVTVETSQMFLFLFLGATALGTLAGGPIGDFVGRKLVIWVSILGAAPFTMALPYVDYTTTAVLMVVIGFIMASSFSAILVFAQELLPGHVGTVAGLFFGLSFGLGAFGAVAIGKLADVQGLSFVYQLCSFLPLLGLITILLPSDRRKMKTRVVE